MLHFFLFAFFMAPLPLSSQESNILLGAPVQVTSEISGYENIVAGAPIEGLVMITHDANHTIQTNSFTLGNKPLEVFFVKAVPMSLDKNIVVAIYQFTLPGMPSGLQTLDPIKVIVGGKLYQAPPMIFQVN